MLLCQISDPHVVEWGSLAYGKVDTSRHLERCVRKILSLPRQPDALIATGDLTCNATAVEYGVLREILAPLNMPLFLAVGNHDDRQLLRAAFPQDTWLAGEGGFVQYVVDDFSVRLVVLDTQIPHRPGGMLCEQRLAWLDRTLAASDRPTIVAQHHPPFPTGLSFMDDIGLDNPAAEAAVISKYTHVQRVICGHQHRTSYARFAGTVASICPSTAHQLVLDLVPGNEIGFTLEPSGFQLHLWDGKQLVTHTGVVEDYPSWGSRE